VLDVRQLLRGPGFALSEVRCSHDQRQPALIETAARDALVIVRSGTFRRRVGGSWDVLERNVAYFQRSGDEQEFAHPVAGGDRCMTVTLGPAFAHVELPPRAFATHARVDLLARRLLARARAGSDGGDLEEAALEVTSAALDDARAQQERRGLPSRHRLAERAREALAEDMRLGLASIASRLDCTPDHLGRAFRETSGSTFTAYRRRMRVRVVLERIAEGDADLARLAAEAGFADHAHMTRSIKVECGATPGSLRELIRADGWLESRRGPAA